MAVWKFRLLKVRLILANDRLHQEQSKCAVGHSGAIVSLCVAMTLADVLHTRDLLTSLNLRGVLTKEAATFACDGSSTDGG